ncbi:hypothetical protein CRG98_021696 [Punica granatum]|uniref:Uncharacterized protein n=1 Tax=Punica granatum TaxID=22663 RepID=A0A2I0JNP3_PUNGR|nr:hypothetical protein CRG98_021696 [Punica granatum]
MGGGEMGLRSRTGWEQNVSEIGLLREEIVGWKMLKTPTHRRKRERVEKEMAEIGGRAVTDG